MLALLLQRGNDRLGDARPERDAGAELRDRREHARLQRRLPSRSERRPSRLTVATTIDVSVPGRLPVPAEDDATARRQRQRLRAGSDPARAIRPPAATGRSRGRHAVIGSNYRLTFTTRPSLAIGPTAASAQIDATGSPTADTPTPRERHRRRHLRAEQHAGHGEADLERLVLPLVHHGQLRRRLLHVPGAGGRDAGDVPPEPSAGRLRPRRVRPGGAQQLRPPQPTTPPLDGAPLADSGYGTTHATDALAPQTLNDVALVLRPAGVRRLDAARDAGRRRRR